MLNSRLFILFIYLLGACLLGCFIAYPIYAVTALEFDRVLSRSILICVVLLFYPAYRLLQFKSPAELGFVNHNKTKTTKYAWLIGIVMLIPLSLFFFNCGFRVLEPLDQQSLSSIVATIILAILSGLIIGLIEETLFRGLLQTSLIDKYRPAYSILIVSILYSSVHFLEAPEVSNAFEVQWHSGFNLFFSAFQPLLQPHLYWDSWLALFMAGVFLSIVRLRTQNLFWCIGIHAGWVTHIKIIKSFTDRDNTAECRQWAGDYDKYIGEMSIFWIVLVLIAWWIYARTKTTS